MLQCAKCGIRIRMLKQKDTTHGTVISFRLPNRIVRKLSAEARNRRSDEVVSVNQLARKLTLAGMLKMSIR